MKTASPQNKLKFYHLLLSMLMLPLCILLFATGGWAAFSTITKRSGLNGDMYSYYGLSRFEYSFYNIIVSLSGLLCMVMLLTFLTQRKPAHLTKVFVAFLILSALIVSCEVYLNARFAGKG